MAHFKSLTDLLVCHVRLVYDAERRLTRALPPLEAAASSIELRQAFRSHFEETEAHVDRLEQVFGSSTSRRDRRPATA
jgi:ferritin-like metal-binding protein YciE